MTVSILPLMLCIGFEVEADIMEPGVGPGMVMGFIVVGR